MSVSMINLKAEPYWHLISELLKTDLELFKTVSLPFQKQTFVSPFTDWSITQEPWNTHTWNSNTEFD